jgi:N-glycosylase/DNA lyase
VCLFGLGWSEAVPVDTHVWQIAQRDYKFGKGKHASMTPAMYIAIGNLFRKLWGKEAGWAHSVLFTADLKAFSERLVAKIEVKEEETAIKMEDGDAILGRIVKNEQAVVKVEEETTRRSKRRKA